IVGDVAESYCLGRLDRQLHDWSALRNGFLRRRTHAGKGQGSRVEGQGWNTVISLKFSLAILMRRLREQARRDDFRPWAPAKGFRSLPVSSCKPAHLRLSLGCVA